MVLTWPWTLILKFEKWYNYLSHVITTEYGSSYIDWYIKQWESNLSCGTKDSNSNTPAQVGAY